MFALNGTLMALDVLGLPFLGVPMMAQFRHDTRLKPIEWFGKLEYTAIKWSTAGDFMVNDNGRKVVVYGKSANAPLRTAAGVYCNVRPYGTITCVRFMPGLPYSQDSKKFQVDRATGTIHSEMNTPGVRMAYAVRLFLKMVHETGQIGRAAIKPTQAQEDAVNAGILRWLLQGTRFELKRRYAVDAYAEHKANVDAIVALLPGDFKAGMENWGGEINEHISDTNFGILLHDMVSAAQGHHLCDGPGRRPPDRPHGRRPRRAARLGAEGAGPRQGRRRHEEGLARHGLHHDQRQGHDERDVPHGG